MSVYVHTEPLLPSLPPSHSVMVLGGKTLFSVSRRPREPPPVPPPLAVGIIRPRSPFYRSLRPRHSSLISRPPTKTTPEVEEEVEEEEEEEEEDEGGSWE
ncbi:hypothetical protein ANTPLA_LOCUS5600 [Anthophora plagiata]